MEAWQELLEGTTEASRGEEKYGNKCDSAVPGPVAHTPSVDTVTARARLASSHPAPAAVLFCCLGANRQGFLLPRHSRDQARPCSRKTGIVNSPSHCRLLGSAGQEVTARVVIPHLWMTHRSRCLLLGLTGSGPCSPLANKVWFL